MNESEILNWISKNIVQIIIVLSIFIQISPIKWNPLTSLLNWTGKLITSSVAEKVEEISKTIDDIKK